MNVLKQKSRKNNRQLNFKSQPRDWPVTANLGKSKSFASRCHIISDYVSNMTTVILTYITDFMEQTYLGTYYSRKHYILSGKFCKILRKCSTHYRALNQTVKVNSRYQYRYKNYILQAEECTTILHTFYCT